MAPQGGAFSLCLQGNLGGPLGSTVTQQNCNPDLTDASQLWLPIALGGSIYKFQNIGTGRCLEARNGAVNGGAVDLWDCSSGESNERWYWPPGANGGNSFSPGLNPIQTRVSNSTGFCLDIPDAHLRLPGQPDRRPARVEDLAVLGLGHGRQPEFGPAPLHRVVSDQRRHQERAPPGSGFWPTSMIVPAATLMQPSRSSSDTPSKITALAKAVVSSVTR